MMKLLNLARAINQVTNPFFICQKNQRCYFLVFLTAITLKKCCPNISRILDCYQFFFSLTSSNGLLSQF